MNFFMLDFARIPMQDHQPGLMPGFGRVLGNIFFIKIVVEMR